MKTKPKYALLADALRLEIDAGDYQPGDKLLSEHELAARHSLSRQTVRQALSVLESEGLIERRHGSGSIVKEQTSAPTIHDSGNHTVAVITTYIREYIFPDILRPVEEALTNHGYSMTLFATKNRVDNERKILESILKQPPAGLIIEGTKTALPNPNIDLYREFERRGIPIVFIHGWYPELSSAVRVVADDKMGGRIATEHLIAKGHRNIAGIFKSDDIQGHLRYAGYAEAMRNHNLPVVDDNVLWYTTESKEMIFALGTQVISGCTAMVCYNDEETLQLLSLLRQADISVPDDLSIISFDNSTYSELATPRISSCSQHKHQIGVLAAQKIIHLIKGIPQESSALPWRVIEKESVKAI